MKKNDTVVLERGNLRYCSIFILLGCAWYILYHTKDRGYNMSYKELINQKIGNVYQAGIATKIIQHMGRIRNSSDINQARRWVMELLQNAGDVAWPGVPVKVRLELTEQQLKFMHTGMPFRIKDVLSIVNQVSSKVEDENTVGQFGTGFVTTFLLSEKVNLKGILKEEGEVYKEFNICIDRQGNTQEEILRNIDSSMKALMQIDDADEVHEYSKDEYNTVFTYFLNNERSRSVAKIGMEDLRETVFFVLLFSENIESIELNYELERNRKTVKYTKCGNKLLGNDLQCGEFVCEETGKASEKIQIYYVKKEKMTLAANYSEEKGFLPLSEKCPRLFVKFPLIGAENFCFPIVINSLELEPNEPRSGISLVDNENSRDAIINKRLMEQAVELYKIFLTDALRFSLKGLDQILQIPMYEDSKEWSKEWVKGHIYKPLYEDIVTREFIQTTDGMKAIQSTNMFLIRGENSEERSKVKELLSYINGIYCPVDEVNWYSVLAAYELPEEKIYDLDKLLWIAESIIRQEGKIKKNFILTVKWCEKLYRVALKREDIARRIYAGEIAIFPNQVLEGNRVWHLKRYQDIYIDPGIPEIIKDVTEVLDKIIPKSALNGMECCNLRKNLLHKDFSTEELQEFPIYDCGKLANYIITKTNENFQAMQYCQYASEYKKYWKQAWIMMVSCGPDKEMYELVQQCFMEKIPEYGKEDSLLEANVWKNSYYGLLRCCIKKISDHSKLEELPWKNAGACEGIYAWLNLFYKKWVYYRYGDEDGGAAIYLNQHGMFKNRIGLRRDNIESEELKEIAYRLKELSEDCDFYEQLLHKEILVEDILPMSYTDKEVALEINRVVSRLLTQKNLSEANIQHQEACSELLAWIQSHPKEAESYFPAFSSEEEQMKLLTPKAAVRMNQKVHKLECIKEMLHCSDDEKILEIIGKYCAEKGELDENRVQEFTDGDVIFDKNIFTMFDISEGDEDCLRRVCREIGIAGERYALERVRNHYIEQGMRVVHDNGDEIRLIDEENKTGRIVTLFYPDNASYHQKGWDICIEDSNNEGIYHYLEVKTHTSRSYVRSCVRLSNEQMKMAISEGKNYHVLVVVYDYHSKKGQEIIWYDGFLKYIANGKLKHIDEEYIFSA